MKYSMPLLLHSSILLFVCAIFVLNLHLSLSLDWFSTCSSRFSCGNITDVDYPFWGESRLEGCGHPQLKLNCEHERNLTTIEIANVKYHVLELKKEPQILKITRPDFQHGICSPEFGNTSLDSDLLEYALGFGDVLFSYNCTKTSSTFLNRFFTCPSDSVNSNGYVSLKSDMEAGICNSSVNVVVKYESYYGAIGNTSMMETALREGFEVQYKVDLACSECKRSNGVCGYDSNSSEVRCYCPNQLSSGLSPCLVTTPDEPGSSLKRKWAIGISAALSGIIVISVLIFCKYKSKFGSRTLLFWKEDQKEAFYMEAMLRKYGSFSTKRYTYAEVKKMTNSFAGKIGNGGFGTVYKGKLPDGSLVAVKMLKESKGNGEEFVNEVSSISKTWHINIVTLLGFCYERDKRALIYEYMPKGSLDKFIFNQESSNTKIHLGWKTLFEIAAGIARGLEYLHRGCISSILHFDIKPHNILLDDDFVPKISDFGLAKLCQEDNSIVSMLCARGTAGYAAPEIYWRNFGEVSYKSDVYSYGMMVLEMVGGRKNIDAGMSRTSEIYFPDWVYKHIEDDENFTISEEMTNEDDEIVRKMILVSLWCIQTMPANRPSMTKVVEMLEGSLQSLQIPPKPSLALPQN